MAPGTNIGAATPVSGTGEALEETLASKVENDAAALIRSIAQERGRNQDALESTVREAASFSANEALELDIIDFVVEDLDHLLRQIDGHRVELVGEPEGRVLQTENMQLRRLDKNLLEGFLEFISDPNVSFLLLTIGGLGIVFELFSPGLIVPGVTGVICLLLALLAFGNLPVNWAAAAFILLAVILAVLETQFPALECWEWVPSSAWCWADCCCSPSLATYHRHCPKWVSTAGCWGGRRRFWGSGSFM